MNSDNDNSNTRERSRSRSRERGNNRSEFDDDRSAADGQQLNNANAVNENSGNSKQDEGFNLYITNLSFQVHFQCSINRTIITTQSIRMIQTPP